MFFAEIRNNPIICLLAENKIELKEKILSYKFIDVYLTVIDKLKEIKEISKRN